MIGPRAFACAVVLLSLAGCGDGSGPDSSTSPAGLWDFTFDGIWTGFGGTVSNTCHTEFTVKITEIPPGNAFGFEARVPFTAQPYCNGVPLETTFPALLLLMNQDADQLTLVMDNVDTLLVASYHGASMDGTIANPRQFGFLGPNFVARRRAGTTDPNEDPAFVEVQAASNTLAAGDSLLVSGRVLNGYGDAPDDPTFIWSSSDAGIATVESRPPDQSGALALVRGVQPGGVYIKATVGDATDSLQLTLLEPAASSRRSEALTH
jgi:uncharacterized protein YjdB